MVKAVLALLFLAATSGCRDNEPHRDVSAKKPVHESASSAHDGVSEAGMRCQGDKPRRVSGAHLLPERIGGADPDFAGCDIRHGLVVVKATIGTTGDIVSVAAVKAPNKCMSNVAVAAVKLWKFCPGERRGQPVEDQMTFTIHSSPRE